MSHDTHLSWRAQRGQGHLGTRSVRVISCDPELGELLLTCWARELDFLKALIADEEIRASTSCKQVAKQTAFTIAFKS